MSYLVFVEQFYFELKFRHCKWFCIIHVTFSQKLFLYCSFSLVYKMLCTADHLHPRIKQKYPKQAVKLLCVM